jgi:hypothetical protein
MTETSGDTVKGGSSGPIDRSHLLLVGAGPGLGWPSPAVSRPAVIGSPSSLEALTACAIWRAAWPTSVSRSHRFAGDATK